MDSEHFISYAKDRSVELSLTSDLDLNVSAPKGFLTQEIVIFLKNYKDPVVDQLCKYEFQNEIFRIIFPDDIGFVVSRVRYVSGRKRLEIVRSYLKEFDVGYKAEPNPVKKRNAGRQRANAWIREEKFY